MVFHPTDQQIQAIPLLASGQSYSRVAEAVGTSPSTVCRWLKNPEFKKQVEAIQVQKLEITKSVVVETASAKAENFQDTLQTALQHQDEVIENARQITTKCLTLLNEVVNQVDRLIKSEDRDTGLTPKEKALLNFLPNLMRTSTALIATVNDTWDRRYGIEEISKRLDEWQTRWDDQDKN